MRVKTTLAAALLCAFAASAFAQHDHGAKKPEMDPAMMEAMMKAGTPGDPHKKLDGMIGTWDTKMNMWMMPGADPIAGTGTATNQWILGGRYVEHRFEGNMMGMPFTGLGHTGYDNIKKQYFGTWMDSMSTGMMSTIGVAETDGTFTFTGMMSDPMTGKDAPVKEKITVTDADHHTMEMWCPAPDGKMFKTMEIAYTRKK